ncbi:Spermatid-associated protein [Struthio camelus australis]|uniref:Spermatid-associated protein n=1 Tax=Struthio camelus australis TaxID=441894 RepID=A0A093GY87_STRCA|nr:PREDICTED: spermatid-associated protein [Struthio camelus australis]KFV72095.1 Spermatid-associated protein [Struthio camelus australis]
MSACDLMNHNMQCTRTDIDCTTPRVKLSDETFIFIDGKWVNEIYHQPPFASHEKHFSKKTQSEWSIWEENRALLEENKVLRIENSMLQEENKALRCLQAQNKTVKVIYDDTIHQGLQKEKRSFPIFPDSNIGFQISQDNKALQIVRGKNRALEIFRQQNKAFPIIWKNKKAIAVHEESKDTSSVLQKDTQTITDPEEGNPDLAPQQEHEVGSSNPTQNEKSAPAMQGEYPIGQAIQNLYQALQVFLKEDYIPSGEKNSLKEDYAPSGEKKDIQILQEENKVFQEENNKLRLQLNAVKNTVSDITAQMEMLQKELSAITSPVFEEAGQILASEYQLGDM